VALRIPPRDKDFAQPSYVNEAGDARSTETAPSERARARMRDESLPQFLRFIALQRNSFEQRRILIRRFRVLPLASGS